MHAQIAAMYIRAHCKQTFKKPDTMESTSASGAFIDVFDHQGGGSHKYIPADKLTDDLGMERGAGVYGYWKMSDGSYLLLTCRGPVAYWSGNPEDKAKWVEDRSDKV